MLTGSSPILATTDVPATIRFYTEVLGFPSSWLWGEPPTFGGVAWGKVTLMFSQQPELAGRVEGHGQWFDAEDVDTLYDQHRERGATIVSAIEDKPWGRREYTVRDPNGYHLRFGGSPSHMPQGSGRFPEGIEVVRRKPTPDEYNHVTELAFGRKAGLTELLDTTWAAVVATDPNGGVIATLRIMADAPGWFSIWDVAILPEWQGQRIGTAMMKEALEIVREASPGAIVFLFTTKHGFYERIGFTTESVDMIRL